MTLSVLPNQLSQARHDGKIRSQRHLKKRTKSTGKKTRPWSPQAQIFQSAYYKVLQQDTTLDGNYNSTMIIADPRMPLSRQANQGINLDKGQSSNLAQQGTKDHTKASPKAPDPNLGIKLNAGLSIHNLGQKSSDNKQIISVKAMKSLARDMQAGMAKEDIDALIEGVDFNSNPSP